MAIEFDVSRLGPPPSTVHILQVPRRPSLFTFSFSEKKKMSKPVQSPTSGHPVWVDFLLDLRLLLSVHYYISVSIQKDEQRCRELKYG
jgi:hypothetical protein